MFGNRAEGYTTLKISSLCQINAQGQGKAGAILIDKTFQTEVVELLSLNLSFHHFAVTPKSVFKFSMYSFASKSWF